MQEPERTVIKSRHAPVFVNYACVQCTLHTVQGPGSEKVLDPYWPATGADSQAMAWLQCPAGRVFQYRVRSGRVVDKLPGSGSGSGRVGVSKNTIGYFRVSFFSFGYFRVFRVFPGMSGIFGYFGYPEYRVVSETPGLPEISGNTRCFGLPATR